MHSFTTIETDGFLSDEILTVIREFKANAPKLHEDFRLLHRLAHQRKNSRPVSNTNVQELMIVLLIGRMLSLYEAIYVLACRGMEAEHRVLLRTMLEARWKLQMCVKSTSNAEELALAGEYERAKMLANALKYRADTSQEVAELRNLHSKIIADNRAQGIRSIPIWKIAERAGSLSEYELAYALLCQPAHTNSRDLQKSFEIDSENKITGVLWGPDHNEAGFCLATAMDYLLQAITNPVVPMLPAEDPEAERLRAAIQHHIVAQYELTRSKAAGDD